MVGNSISDKRTTLDHLDEEMVDRHMMCRFVLISELHQFCSFPMGTPQFDAIADSFRFACVPRLSSWKKAVKVNKQIDKLKIMCDDAGVTLFKIPIHVNDVDEYVTMLFHRYVQGMPKSFFRRKNT